MKKNILNVVIIALVISVVGTLATSLILNGKNVLASPSVAPKNANECTLDNSCEVNSISSRTGEILLNGDARVTGDLLVDGMFSSKGLDCEIVSYDDSEDSGDEYCQDLGYNYCLIGEGEKIITYYDSVDGSCSGKKQIEIRSATLASCPTGGGSGGGSCGRNTNGAEPLLGDGSVGESNSPDRIVCCR